MIHEKYEPILESVADNDDKINFEKYTKIKNILK